jgi:hypothetical protein
LFQTFTLFACFDNIVGMSGKGDIESEKIIKLECVREFGEKFNEFLKLYKNTLTDCETTYR